MDTEQNVDADLREQLAAIEQALRELPGDAELEQAKQELVVALGWQGQNPPAGQGSLGQRLPHPSRQIVGGSNNARIHPRSRYAAEEPDFGALAEEFPALQPFVVQRKGARRSTIDFRDPKACVALTTALLARDFDIHWDLPPGHLIPPLTGRSNYIHWLEDLLELSSNSGDGTSTTRGLDIGTGANLIYPLLGARLCGWSFVGADVNQAALEAAGKLRDANPDLSDLIELRWVGMQPEQQSFFANDAAFNGGPSRAGTGIVSSALLAEEPVFAFSMCNPPFFESMEEAGANPATGFEGTALEMVYPGGEAAFVQSMARDSTTVSQRVHWFTTMVGKKATLKSLRATLQTLGVRALRTTEFAQGRTSRWAVAWSWLVARDTATKPLSRGLPPSKRTAMLAPNQRRYSLEIVGSVAETWKHLQGIVAQHAAPGLVERDAESYAVRVHLAHSSEEEGHQHKRPRTKSTGVSAKFQIYQHQPTSQTVVATLEGDAAGDTFEAFSALVKNIFDSLLSQL